MGDKEGAGIRTEVADPKVADHKAREGRQLARRLSAAIERTATMTRDMTEDISQLLDIQDGRYIPDDSTETPSAQQETENVQHAFQRDLLDPERIMLRDKIVFFTGVVNVVLIGYWVGRSPATYYHFWTAKCCVLFPLRWWTYRKKGMHYLMLELCYFGNLLGIAHVYWPWFTKSTIMRKLFFAYGSGPLLWSILAMRNSLVFHDFDKMTTLMMHASPAITAWTLRWYPRVKDPAASDTGTVYELVILPLFFYFAWVILYYWFTFVALKNRIEGRGRQTMFSLMVPRKDRTKASRSPLARLVLLAPEAYQPIAYLSLHAVAASVAFIPVKFLWDYFYVHTSVLLFCLAVSIWNGGNYYFKVFAKKYINRLEEEVRQKSAVMRKLQ